MITRYIREKKSYWEVVEWNWLGLRSRVITSTCSLMAAKAALRLLNGELIA